MIYFDNAASTFPKPHEVSKSVYNWLENNGANPGRSGHDMSFDASTAIYETRCELSELFNVSQPEKIIFVPNATYGLNFIIQGVLHHGDHVVITDLEHNSVIRTVNLIAKKGIKFDVAVVDLYDDEITLKNIADVCKKNTKLVVCTQCSNVCGKMPPIKKIKNMLGDSVKMLIDGSQGAGIIPTDLSDLGVDYYCATSHKGLLGPQGSGFVAVLSEIPDPIIVGGTGSESFDALQPNYLPDILESGTLPTPVIVGLNSGVKYIKKRGVAEIFKHKSNLTKYFYSKISGLGFVKRYIDYDDSFVGVCCFNINGLHSEEVASILNQNKICVRGGYHCAPYFHKKMGTEDVGMVRVSFGCYNSFSEIDNFVKVLNKLKKV